MNTPRSSNDNATDHERAILEDLGSAHELWSAGVTPVLLGRGAENITFAVGDFIVRFAGDREAMAREVDILRSLPTLTRVPTPFPLVDDPARGVLIYRRLPGESQLARPGVVPTDCVAALSNVLAAVRRLPMADTLPLEEYAPDAWLNEATLHFQQSLAYLDANRASTIAAFLCARPPRTRTMTVPQHNDLGAEHILITPDGVISGVIDWTDVARTDPACDLGLLYRDFGALVAFNVASAMDGPPNADERNRIRFHARCKWLEDFRYAIEDPQARDAYLRNCDLTFAHTFEETS